MIMDILGSIKDRFIEELTTTVSIHKIFIFLIFLLFFFQFHVLVKKPTVSVDYVKEIRTESIKKENNKIISTTEKLVEKKILQQPPLKDQEHQEKIKRYF